MDSILYQDNINLTINTPLDVSIILDRLEGTEGLSQPFEFTLQLHAAQSNLDFSQLLGQELTVKLDLGSAQRYFSGIVGKLEQHQTIKDENGDVCAYYEATIYPQLWLLKFSRDHRIFQNMSAIEIITTVLKENNLTNINNQVTNSGQNPREYCVQYGESYFDFASRLMEEEGIFYFFTYDENGHTLVLTDNNQSATAINTEIGLSLAETTQPLLNKITHFSYQQQVVPGQFIAADYNYLTPSTQLSPNSPGNGLGGAVYEFPGRFGNISSGEAVTNYRIQELEWPRTLVSGKGTAFDFAAGKTFALEQHPRDDFNQEYMLYRVKHTIHQKTAASQEEEGFFSYDNKNKPHLTKIYKNEFSAFPAITPFRAPRVTQKRRIYSNQTAVVTGPAGQEIFCDADGRIKIHFHWDLKNNLDENSSCWVRVAQSSAGNGWGMVVIPRIGMEVIVTFIEGDPDLPLVIGCVYNGDNKPANYPAESPTKTSFKSSSSPAVTGGGGGGVLSKLSHSATSLAESKLSSAEGKVQGKITNKLGKFGDVADQLMSNAANAGEEYIDDKIYNTSAAAEEATGQQFDDVTTGITGKAVGQLGGSGNQLQSLLGYSGAKASAGFNELRFEDKTGSEEFYMHAEKDMVVEIKNSRTETIISGTDDLTVKTGSKSLTIEGPGAGYTIRIAAGDLTVEVDGNISFECTENISLTAGKSIKMKAGDSISSEAGISISEKAGDSISEKAGDSISSEAGMKVSIKGGLETKISGGLETKISGGLKSSMEGGAMCEVKAALVQIS